MKNHKDHRGSSGEERQRWHEWGVSEVIGVVLLLSLVIVGGTVVGTQFLSQPSPREIPSVNFLANYDDPSGNLTLYHTGGDTLPKDQYKFLVQYKNGPPVTFLPKTDWSSGHPLNYPALSQPGKVTLVYTGNGAGDTALRSVVIGDVGNDTRAGTTTTTPTGIPTTVTTTPTGTVPTTETTIPTTITTAPTTTVPTTVPTTVITTPTVAPTILYHTINVTSGLYGQVQANEKMFVAGAPGSISVVDDGQVNFTFTPTIGFHLANVNYTTDTSESGTFPAVENAYTLSNVTRNYSVTASFAINTYTIRVTASQGGSVTAVTNQSGTVTIPPGTAGQQITVAYGEQPNFTFTPDVGSHIKDIAITGTSKGPIASYQFPPVVDNSNTVVATFAANIYTVNVTSGQNGSVQANEKTAAAGTTTIVNVSYNGQVNFTYLPVTGYHVSIVSYTAEDGSLKELLIKDNASILSGIKSNTTVVANFAVDTFIITVTQPKNGTITYNNVLVTAPVTVNYHDTPTFTFTPETGYHLDTVKVDGAPVTTSNRVYTFPPVTAPHTLAATFTVDTFTINATVGDHGAINPKGIITVNYGESKDFTITADTGYHITSVMVDSTPLTVPAGNTSYPHTFSIITSNHTINASFAINTYTINATAGEHGTITPKGTLTVDYGDSRTFTITPETGYKIADVKVDNVSQGAVTTYALTNIQSDHTITASFTRITYSINAYTDVKLGSISPPGSLTYNYHDTPSFTITPVTGYHITSILVDGMSLGPNSTYTFAALENNHTITANFAINTFTITATAGEGGSISPQGIVSANYGDSKTFAITPNSGSEIDTIFVDGVAVGETNSFKFTQINGNHTINVLFDIGGTGPYSIEGTVWNDLNGDGANQSTEPPLEGWNVTVNIYNGPNSPLTRSLVTGKDGYYKFDKLPKGHYYVSQVAKSGWDQTYPTQHGGRDIDNLNPGRSDKHQHVTGVDFLNHLINGTFIPGTDFLLQANRPGYIEQGGFISFNITNTWSWVDMKPSGGTTTRYPLNVGDKAKIVIKSDSYGKIDAQFPQITTFEFPNVDLFINDNLITTGAVPAIYVSMYDTYLSTLTLKVSAPTKGLDFWNQLRWSKFKVDNTWVVKPENPYQFNDWEYVIYNLKPSSSGVFHLNTNSQNLGEYYGGGDGYQMY